MLTQNELKQLFNYDPETGIFRWKIYRQGIKKNNIAGCKDRQGYCTIRVKGKDYKAHRLVWLFVYGYFPENQIDHINKIKNDNRICNLREISNQCNIRNCGLRKDNTSGVKGICWYKKIQKWTVYITINRKTQYIGRYKDFDDAVCARLAAEQCVDWSGCDSSSPAFQYVQKMLGK